MQTPATTSATAPAVGAPRLGGSDTFEAIDIGFGVVIVIAVLGGAAWLMKRARGR